MLELLLLFISQEESWLKKQLKSIRTSLDSIKEEYNIGTKTITDLIDAESALLDINVNFHNSRKNMTINRFKMPFNYFKSKDTISYLK